jgi:hypothetical protein
VTTSKRRLDQLEGALSPTEVVLRWMHEAHQYPTVPAYMDALRDASDTQYPMMHLPQHVEQAVRAAMKGAKPEVITRAVRQAVREVVFLFSLQLQVNTRLWADWRAMCLHLAYVACKLGGLCHEEDPTDADLAEAREHAEQAIGELLQWNIAIKKIADRYYAGGSPLFPGYAAQLAESIATGEQIIALFNDHLVGLRWLRTKWAKGKTRKSPPLAVAPIDLDALKQAITPAGVDLARHIVVMAQAEAAEFLGETRQALQLVRAYLWPDADGG